MTAEQIKARDEIANLQAHAREHGWQDVDEPIAALLAFDLASPSPLRDAGLRAWLNRRIAFHDRIVAENPYTTGNDGLRDKHEQMADVLREELKALALLDAPPTAAQAIPTRERFAHCAHCGLIANPEICPRCGRERDSGVKPLYPSAAAEGQEP